MKTLTKTEPRPETDRPVAQRERGYLLPPVNIIETNDAYRLEAEMPGVNKDGLEVLLEGNELTLVGRRETELPNAQLVYRESNPRDFRRVFVLDPAIDSGRIEAKMVNGILLLNLPKAEHVKPKRITISD